VVDVGDFSDQAGCLQREWEAGQRWTGIQREYSAEDVIRLRGSVAEDHAMARRGARRLWELLGREDAVRALGAITGDQAVQMVQAGLQAIYLSGWQVSADGNLAAQTYSGQSLHPASSVPQMVRRINNAMLCADQIAWPKRPAGSTASEQQWVAPIVADAQAGFGGGLDAFMLMKAMIEAGAAGVHFEDRLPSQKAYGNLGGRVLIPTGEHIKTLNAARLAADVLNVPSLVIARTYAHETSLLASDVDERDHEFLTGERTAEGFHLMQPGLYARVTRALAFAPYADLLWLETSTPNLAEARAFADIIYSQYPDKLLAYSCSPAFDWAHLDDASIAKFQDALTAMGYRFQFITATGFHAPNDSIPGYARDDLSTSTRLQEAIKPDAETTEPAGSKERVQFAVSAS
jgi:isocitrate lyase